jgi:uncharacterized membrane protein YfcA
MAPLSLWTGPVARIRPCRPDRRTIVLAVAGAAAGALCGLLGVAGGVVIVPVLTSRRVGMTRAVASGTTIAAVFPISVVAAVTYAGLHDVDGRAAAAVIPGAAAGVILGSLLASRVRAPVLRALFNLVLLATAIRLLVALPRGSVGQIAVEVPAAVALGALGSFAGLASGLLGSGGGTFLVPALVLGFGLTQQVAQGTALLAFVPIWIIGALTHHKARTLRLREAAVMGSCGALTVPVGAEIAARVGALPLRFIFAAFLIATVSRGLLPARPSSRARRGAAPAAAASQPQGPPRMLRTGASTHQEERTMAGTMVDKFLHAIENAAIPDCDAWSADATLDATTPNWRTHKAGADAIRAEYAQWFADPAHFDELRRLPVAGVGELVEYTLSWQENGVPHAAHHMHLLTVRDDRIVSDTVFCGGRWPAGLLAEIEAADD